MYYYKKLLFILLTVSALLSQRTDAHSTLISTYLLEKSANNEWQLTISVPLISLHQALLTYHEEKDLWIKDNEYNTPLVVTYLQKNSNINVNTTTQVQLEKVNVKLDNHQSNFIFTLKNMPTNITRFDFTIPAMSENAGHVNIVRIKGIEKNKKVVLQRKNNYAGHINL